ncbi:glycoside hydrolase family 30 beta sandwich domain-containing protein [Flavobacterium sp.]|uniref:glycoside hydrolase family 30 protein n=1 Tax=Flavobacterium sp. TaxID=239 RepID=UPI0035B264EB
MSVRNKYFNLLPLVALVLYSCSSSVNVIDKNYQASSSLTKNKIDFWMTNPAQSIYLQQQKESLVFGTNYNTYPTITVDENQTYQEVDGFGFTLTGGSVQAITMLDAPKRTALLQELFGKNDNSISISYLRISIGASDLNEFPFTYDDVPLGQTDVAMQQFSLSPDKTTVIPMLKEILSINPEIKLLATPWSAPTWMKTNNAFIGGSLKTEYYEAYANYFVKYIQKMKEEGILITAITPQNEPLHPGNNPSMYMTALEQANFIKNHLGPAFAKANLKTKIIIYDHNCNKPEYPLAILNDAGANPYVDGSAFHLYEGDISALSTVHNAYPNKNVYFTEQYTGTSGTFDGDLKWHLKNVIIGSMRNWSKTAFEWNLANDANFRPYTPGGCSTCKGALTINSAENFERNVGYYIIAHVSKFVPSGSVRIDSEQHKDLNTVAFKTPKGNKVLIVENDGFVTQLFNIKNNGKWVTVSLESGAVATFIW